jgi:hypothetical protein
MTAPQKNLITVSVNFLAGGSDGMGGIGNYRINELSVF